MRTRSSLAATLWLCTACTSFSTVRSAVVTPGVSTTAQASLASPPGDVTGWFWSFDCSNNCNYRVIGGDLGFMYAPSRDSAKTPIAFGGGVNGLFPYAEGYAQLRGGERPFGIGARVGLPVYSWREHQLYARYDVPLRNSKRLLFNPALFIHEGNSPNEKIPGSFIGLVQGIGLLFEGERVSWTPAVSIVAGRAQRTVYGQRRGPEGSLFGTASLSFTVHPRRTVTPR